MIVKRDDAESDGAQTGHAAAVEEEAETLTYEVSAEEAGARLDAYLAARVEGWSRARLRRLIEEGEVLVGDETRKASYKLRAGETVEVELAALPSPLRLTPENLPLEIVYEDSDLVVVNKPAQMVVHPAAGVHGGTLANALAFHFRQLSTGSGGRGDAEARGGEEGGENDRSLRPGIVHRLDRDTSGLIVVAKTEAAHESLSEQFRAREVFKSYVALVHGRVKEASGQVEEPIGRDPRHRTRMAVVRRGGRAALSLYRVRRSFERFTLLDVEIKTGRTHQIRVHLAWLKHPVVGDDTYGAGRDQNLPDARLRGLVRTLGRQFLHAARLGFRHPRTGEALRFDAPLPVELREFLDRLETD